MNAAAEKVMEEALSLDPQARAFVAERLIESLDTRAGEELSQEWREEVVRRCREIDDGKIILRDAQKVFTDAYSQLSG